MAASLLLEASWLMMRAAWVANPTITVISGIWVGSILYRQIGQVYDTVQTANHAVHQLAITYNTPDEDETKECEEPVTTS